MPQSHWQSGAAIIGGTGGHAPNIFGGQHFGSAPDPHHSEEIGPTGTMDAQLQVVETKEVGVGSGEGQLSVTLAQLLVLLAS